MSLMRICRHHLSLRRSNKSFEDIDANKLRTNAFFWGRWIGAQYGVTLHQDQACSFKPDSIRRASTDETPLRSKMFSVSAAQRPALGAGGNRSN